MGARKVGDGTGRWDKTAKVVEEWRAVESRVKSAGLRLFLV